jgi:hypothetical protein
MALALERSAWIERLEHPPFIARAPVVANRRVAALGRAVVRDHGEVLIDAVKEQIPAHEMQALLTNWLVPPEDAPNGGVDPVGADEHIDLGLDSVAELEADTIAVVNRVRQGVTAVKDAIGDRSQHPLVRPRPRHRRGLASRPRAAIQPCRSAGSCGRLRPSASQTRGSPALATSTARGGRTDSSVQRTDRRARISTSRENIVRTNAPPDPSDPSGSPHETDDLDACGRI